MIQFKWGRLLAVAFVVTQAVACSIGATTDNDKKRDDPPITDQSIQALVVSDDWGAEDKNSVSFSNRVGSFSYSFDYYAPQNMRLRTMNAGGASLNCDLDQDNLAYQVYELEGEEEYMILSEDSMGFSVELEQDKYYRLKLLFTDVEECLSYSMSFWAYPDDSN